MRCLAVLLSAVLSSAPDGGTDAPFADPDAGVYQVAWASQSDGGVLGPGWWLSPGRMKRVGEHITALRNENEQFRSEATQVVRPTMSFWIGLAAGFAVGVVGTVVLVNEVRK